MVVFFLVRVCAQLVDTLPISLEEIGGDRREIGGDRTKAAAEEAEEEEDLTRALGLRYISPISPLYLP